MTRLATRNSAHPRGPGRTGAIVIGGDYRGLGVVRSLGRRGIPVWVLYDEHRLACASRFAQRSLAWPTDSTRMLTVMRYSGLIEVEFKRDPRDGRPKLLDMNPRVWGWHTLGGRAGADFAHLQWRLSHGETPPAVRARAGVRWVRLTTDVPTALREAARGHLSPGAYFRSLRGPLEYATWSLDDPLPALAELPLVGYMAATRAIAQRTRGLASVRKHGAAQSATSEP